MKEDLFERSTTAIAREGDEEPSHRGVDQQSTLGDNPILQFDLEPVLLHQVELRVKLSLDILLAGQTNEVAGDRDFLAGEKAARHFEFDELEASGEDADSAGEIKPDGRGRGEVGLHGVNAMGLDGVESDGAFEVGVLAQTDLAPDRIGDALENDRVRALRAVRGGLDEQRRWAEDEGGVVGDEQAYSDTGLLADEGAKAGGGLAEGLRASSVP